MMEVRIIYARTSLRSVSSICVHITGYAYFGANSAPLSAVGDGLSWEHWLSEPDQKLRLEDSKVPLQAYPSVPYLYRWRLYSLTYGFVVGKT
jgi:hypothetical protein